MNYWEGFTEDLAIFTDGDDLYRSNQEENW